jgi:hypothetical protein
MLGTKRTLAFEDIEAQTALELPERETPATVVISCLAVCVGKIEIKDINVNVAAAICANIGAVVSVLNLTLLGAGFNGGNLLLACNVKGANK